MLSRTSCHRRRRLGRAVLACLWVGVVANVASAWAPGPMPCVQPGPYAGHVNHAHVAAPFRWGEFGAERFYPRVAWGRDYNGDLMRWSVHRGY